MKKILLIAVFALAVIAGGFYYFYNASIPGFWHLDAANSSINFTSVKNGDIFEQHTISGLEGEADFSGEFLIVVDMNTIETNIDIRNERMRDFLLETVTWPTATISGSFDPAAFEDLSVGERLMAFFPVDVYLHGVHKEMEIEATVFREAWDRVIVVSVTPVRIDAADFNLVAGLETLRGLVGLDEISPVSQISFALTFEGSATP